MLARACMMLALASMRLGPMKTASIPPRARGSAMPARTRFAAAWRVRHDAESGTGEYHTRTHDRRRRPPLSRLRLGGHDERAGRDGCARSAVQPLPRADRACPRARPPRRAHPAQSSRVGARPSRRQPRRHRPRRRPQSEAPARDRAGRRPRALETTGRLGRRRSRDDSGPGEGGWRANGYAWHVGHQ